MISRRGFLTGAAAAAVGPLTIHPARAIGDAANFGALLPSIGEFFRAVYFVNGAAHNSPPSAAFNQSPDNPGASTVPAVAPAKLDLPNYTNSFFWGGWFNSIDYPEKSFPLFGLYQGNITASQSQEVISVKILPQGVYPVYPFIQNFGKFQMLVTNNPTLQVRVINPLIPSQALQFYAELSADILYGIWRLLLLSFNPGNYSPGNPATLQVLMAGPRDINNSSTSPRPPTMYQAYQAPVFGAHGNQPVPGTFPIPVGNAFNVGNPTAWVGFDPLPKFTNIPVTLQAQQQNAYVGAMEQLIFDAGSSSTGGYPGVDLNDIINQRSLMDPTTLLGKPLNTNAINLPDGQGIHTPTVKLSGSAFPTVRPVFLRNVDTLYIDGQYISSEFATPPGFVDIQSIEFGQQNEGRPIGDPYNFSSY